jgi:hypothetical protein
VIQDWFVAFAVEHRERHPSAGLPDPRIGESSTFYAAWIEAFREERVLTYEIATRASVRLVREPAKGERWHLATLLIYAREFHDQAEPERGPERGPSRNLSTREDAEAASKSCDRCGGCGLTTVYRSREIEGKRIPPTVGAYCVCAFGRWIRGNHAARSPELLRRIPDLANVLAGRSFWLAEMPRPELESDPPLSAF